MPNVVCVTFYTLVKEGSNLKEIKMQKHTDKHCYILEKHLLLLLSEMRNTTVIFIGIENKIQDLLVCFSLLSSLWPPPAVCLRDCGPVVPGCSVLRAILCDLPASGKHPTASKACDPGSAVCLDLLLHLDLPSSAGLEQIHYKQDRNHLWAWLVRNICL